MNSALGAGQGTATSSSSLAGETWSQVGLKTADELATIQGYNRILNILDPPKDLHDGINIGDLEGGPDKSLKEILKELFSPNEALPDGYQPVANTKKKLMETFGFTTLAENKGVFGKFIHDKASSLIILREKHSSGQDARPTGLYVAQDTGPNDVVTEPQFIITPGTIIDPAGKTKENPDGKPADYTPIDNYGTLPESFIQSLNMGNIIKNFQVTKNKENTKFTVTLETKFAQNDNINVVLDGKFDPVSGANEDYYKGNPVKNKYILDNKASLTDATKKLEVKKYLLVKELGDTFQVQWLNYMFVSPKKPKELPQDDEFNLPDRSKFNRGNTVIITNDTVVFFRSLINKVGVILTYKGKSRLFKPMELDAAAAILMDASLIKTIREEVVRHNLSIINIILDVIAKSGGQGDTWVGGTSWQNADIKNKAKSYLEKLVTHLKNLNKDIDIYLSAIPTVSAANHIASRSHFLSPFVWCKSGGGYYKIVTSVNSLVEDGRVKFTGLSFKANNNRLATQLSDKEFFQDVGVAGGGAGSQSGGAGTRRKKDAKVSAAAAAKTNEQVDALLNKSIDEEFAKDWNGEEHSIPKIIINQVKPVESIKNPAIVGNASKIEEFGKWSINTTATAPTIGGLKANAFFLYCYVRDFYPEIFKYAYIVKKADKVRNTLYLDEKFPNILPEKIYYSDNDIEGYYNNDDMFIYYEKEGGATYTDNNKTNAFNATLEAIALAKFFVETFPPLQTQHLANFFMMINKWSAFLPKIPDVAAQTEVMESQESLVRELRRLGGGGEKQIHPLADAAMDLYEIYYSLAIKGTYEGKDEVTNKDLDEKLARIEQELKAIQTVRTPMKQITNTLKSTPAIQRKLEKRIYTPMTPGRGVLSFGGKRRYKKTQKKKRKSSKRKTRKHKH